MTQEKEHRQSKYQQQEHVAGRGRPRLEAFGALVVLVIFGLMISWYPSSPAFASRPSNPRSTPQLLSRYGKLPLHFEPCSEANCGPETRAGTFVSRGPGYAMLVAPAEVILGLRSSKDSRKSFQNSMLRMKLIGANPRAKAAALEELPGKSNYFIGNDPAKWQTNVPNYAKVRYQDVYSGIDLVYYGNQGHLEYDLIVAPGTDPGQINLAFEAENLAVSAEGDLVLEVEGHKIHLRKPVVYQEADGGRQEILGSYSVKEKNKVGFVLASYDPSKPLVIDPVLVYSTYLGGSDSEFGNAIAVDTSGNAYVTGATSSTNFPTANAFQPVIGEGTDGSVRKSDVFVTKLNPTGTALVYSTYLGGTGPGSLGPDAGNGIAVDSYGNAYVTGATRSPNFPITPGAFNTTLFTGGGCRANGFVTRLNSNGSALVYSTYIAGCQIVGNGIAVDSLGNAYIVGTVGGQSPTSSHSVVFVAKVNTTGTELVYYPTLGSNGFDQGWGIAVDASGSAYVTGRTNSTDFPLINPLQDALGGGTCSLPFANLGPCYDAFVTKLDPTGAIAYSTYLGGYNSTSGDSIAGDWGNSIAVDSAGNAYVTGLTTSTNFPTANALQPTFGGAYDAFVAKLNATGTALVYSTYLGGSSGDVGNGIALDSDGNVYVTGATQGANFPITPDAFQVTPWGGYNTFVTKLNAARSIGYSTYLSGRIPGGGFPPTPIGGNSNDPANGIAVDLLGNSYVVGDVNSLDFPTMNPIQSAFGGGTQDAFVAKISDPHSMLSNLAGIVGRLNFQQGVRLLQNALNQINAQNPTAACNQLAAFLRQVQAQSGRQLTPAQAEQLKAWTQQIQAALQCR